MEGVNYGGDLTEEAAIEALSLEEQNQLFLQYMETDHRGNRFGLGSLIEVVDGNNEAAGSASLQTIANMKNELEIAHRKLAVHEGGNLRCDEELKKAQIIMSQMEMVLNFLKQKDDGLAAFMASQYSLPLSSSAPTTQPSTAPPTPPSAAPPASASNQG